MDAAGLRRVPVFDDDPTLRKWNLWGYIDARDGAQAVRRALELEATGFDAFIIANADTVMTTPSAELAAAVFPDVPCTAPVEGTETLLSIDKARRVLGYEPALLARRAHGRDLTSVIPVPADGLCQLFDLEATVGLMPRSWSTETPAQPLA